MKKMCKHKDHVGERLLSLDEFPNDKSRPSGKHSKCKACHRKRKAEWQKRVYAGDPDVQPLSELRLKQRERERQRRKSLSIEKSLFISCKGRAARKDLAFSITIDDIVIPKFCPILGIELITKKFICEDGKKNSITQDAYPSVDRIDSSEGYTPSNINIISWRANNLKNNATLHEMVQLGKWAESLA